MKCFCIKVFSFATLLIPVVILTLYFNQPQASSYLYAYQAKQDLLKKTLSPRIILVGGSNLALGLDSDILSARIKGYTPVNMGLHAGLGRSLILNKAILEEIRSGDIVVICLEYQAYGNMPGGAPVCGVVRIDPGVLRDFRLETYAQFCESAFSYFGGQMRDSVKNFLKGRQSGEENPIYRVSGFNEFGDLVSHWPLGHRDGSRAIAPFSLDGRPFDKAIDDLSEFIACVRSEGADVVVSFPAIQEDQYRLNQASMDGLPRILEQRLSVSVVNLPGEMAFPEECFFDTAYHLSYEGVRKRSESLAEGLYTCLVVRDGSN